MDLKTTFRCERFSNGDSISSERYRREVLLHRQAGLNALRVWGGGLAERESFYTACDELGVLVHQEVRILINT